MALTSVRLTCGICGAAFNDLVPVSALQNESDRLRCAAIQLPVCSPCQSKAEFGVEACRVLVKAKQKLRATPSQLATDSLTNAEFEEVKKRFPHYVTDDDRPLGFPTLMRIIEDRIADDKPIT
jgi:hypothetical protein